MVTSDKQINANRRNAQKSTGPKTPEGKSAVRLNARTHGLRSQEVLAPGEDEEALKELDENLRDELQPVGELENLLVDRIVGYYWRLRRLRQVEAGIFAWEHYEELIERAFRGVRKHNRNYVEEQFVEHVGSRKVDKEDREEISKSFKRISSLCEMRDAETATLGRAFIRDADKTNAFSKLSRYETTIVRNLYKGLYEFRRRQAARQTEGDVPSVAPDVNVPGVLEEGP